MRSLQIRGLCCFHRHHGMQGMAWCTSRRSWQMKYCPNEYPKKKDFHFLQHSLVTRIFFINNVFSSTILGFFFFFLIILFYFVFWHACTSVALTFVGSRGFFSSTFSFVFEPVFEPCLWSLVAPMKPRVPHQAPHLPRPNITSQSQKLSKNCGCYTSSQLNK